jgi:hypothetical protein
VLASLATAWVRALGAHLACATKPIRAVIVSEKNPSECHFCAKPKHGPAFYYLFALRRTPTFDQKLKWMET